MRALFLATTLLLAGCGEAEQTAAPVEDAPILLKAGQWTLTRDMTGYNTPTVTREEYAAKVEQDEKTVANICLSIDKDGRPDANAIVGDEGRDCSYKDSSIRKGHVIATLECKKGPKATGGTSELTLEGNYTPDSLTIGVSMTQSKNGKPWLRTTHDLTGKRTGDCKPG